MPSLPVTAVTLRTPPEVDANDSVASLVALASLPSVTEPSSGAPMIVAARADVVVGKVQETVNVAPGRGAPAWSTFDTRRAPPMTKHAGPALRFEACDCDGLSVVLAKLQYSSPMGASAGM